MIIAFFGPDGSGKTTLAKMLLKYFLAHNYKVTYIRLRSHHLIIYLIIRLFQVIGIMPQTNSPRILDYSLRRIFRQSKTFLFLELISVITWLLINVKIRLLIKKQIIIAERYIPDFLVSMKLVTKDSATKSILIRLLYQVILSFMISCNKLFYVYAEPQILLKRKKDENLSLVYLRYLIYNYEKIIDTYNSLIVKINTSYTNAIFSFRKVLRCINYYINQ